MEKAFNLKNVWKKYGATIALRNITLSLGKGLTVIIGPNGSGKSTMLKIMTGLVAPSKGKVTVFGVDPWRNREYIVSNIGIGLEGINLPWWITGIDFLKIFSYTRRVDWEKITYFAEILGVDRYWNKLIREYSMGMRKKLILVAAFSNAKKALVLDEPFTLLDKHSTKIVDETIMKLSKKIPVIIATHIASESALAADRVIILNAGKIVAQATLKGNKFEDYICYYSRGIKDAIELLSSFGEIAMLSYSDNRIFVSYREPVSLSIIKEKIDCYPTLYRWLNYMDYIYGEEK